jgi:hypothetical protein
LETGNIWETEEQYWRGLEGINLEGVGNFVLLKIESSGGLL